MNIVSLRERSRSLVRDLAGAYFAEGDLRNYVNEAIDRMKQVIPELRGMKHLFGADDVITHIGEEWHHLLAVYCASRLCTQDERFFQAGNFMNEFELKLQDLKNSYDAGETEFIDPVTMKPVDLIVKHEAVKNVYYQNKYGRVPKYDEEEIIW